MSAASVPMDGNSVPDMVSDAPGGYQQSGVATGQGFAGNVDEGGPFHTVSNHRTTDGQDIVTNGRLVAGRFDPVGRRPRSPTS